MECVGEGNTQPLEAPWSQHFSGDRLSRGSGHWTPSQIRNQGDGCGRGAHLHGEREYAPSCPGRVRVGGLRGNRWPGRRTPAWLAAMTSWDEPAFWGEKWADIYDGDDELDPTSAVDFLAPLAGGGRALELAIGTGRVALPLAARGVRVA